MITEDRREYLRPFRLALIFTAIGETTYFLVWGLWFFPTGCVHAKLAWTATCTIAMAAVIGMAVMVLVLDRLDGLTALVGSAILYVSILSACTLICYGIDSRFDYFGGASAPALFVLAGPIPAALSAIPYAWLLHTPKGRMTIERLGI